MFGVRLIYISDLFHRWIFSIRGFFPLFEKYWKRTHTSIFSKKNLTNFWKFSHYHFEVEFSFSIATKKKKIHIRLFHLYTRFINNLIRVPKMPQISSFLPFVAMFKRVFERRILRNFTHQMIKFFLSQISFKIYYLWEKKRIKYKLPRFAILLCSYATYAKNFVHFICFNKLSLLFFHSFRTVI